VTPEEINKPPELGVAPNGTMAARAESSMVVACSLVGAQCANTSAKILLL